MLQEKPTSRTLHHEIGQKCFLVRFTVLTIRIFYSVGDKKEVLHWLLVLGNVVFLVHLGTSLFSAPG